MWLLRLLLTLIVAVPVALILLFTGVLAWVSHYWWLAGVGGLAAWVLFVYGMSVVSED